MRLRSFSQRSFATRAFNPVWGLTEEQLAAQVYGGGRRIWRTARREDELTLEHVRARYDYLELLARVRAEDSAAALAEAATAMGKEAAAETKVAEGGATKVGAKRKVPVRSPAPSKALTPLADEALLLVTFDEFF